MSTFPYLYRFCLVGCFNFILLQSLLLQFVACEFVFHLYLIASFQRCTHSIAVQTVLTQRFTDTQLVCSKDPFQVLSLFVEALAK